MIRAFAQFSRYILVPVCLGMIPFFGFAQDSLNSKSDYDYFEQDRSGIDTQSDLSNNALPGPSFSIQTGMMTGLGNDLGTYSYFSPQMRFPVSQRFSLKAGLMLENSPALGYDQEKGFYSSGQNYTRSYLMAGGSYQLDEQLTLSGSGFMEIPKNTGIGGNNGLNNSNKGFRMNMHYEVNEHLHFDVGVQMREGNSHLRNPYFKNGFHSNTPLLIDRPGRMGF